MIGRIKTLERIIERVSVCKTESVRERAPLTHLNTTILAFD